MNKALAHPIDLPRSKAAIVKLVSLALSERLGGYASP